jgi:glycopeptide antibiotics resistance protein
LQDSGEEMKKEGFLHNVLRIGKIVITNAAAIGYCSLLTYVVFFARRRQNLPTRFVNTQPVLKSLREFLLIAPDDKRTLYHFYVNLFGNILLFLPLPFLFYFIFKMNSLVKVFVASVLLSFAIEVIQYIFRLGVADIDDILLNTLGASIGVLTIKLIWKGKPSREVIANVYL